MVLSRAEKIRPPKRTIRVLQHPYDLASFYSARPGSPTVTPPVPHDPAYALAYHYRSRQTGPPPGPGPYFWAAFWARGYAAHRPRAFVGYRHSIGEHGDLFLAIESPSRVCLAVEAPLTSGSGTVALLDASLRVIRDSENGLACADGGEATCDVGGTFYEFAIPFADLGIEPGTGRPVGLTITTTSEHDPSDIRDRVACEIPDVGEGRPVRIKTVTWGRVKELYR